MYQDPSSPLNVQWTLSSIKSIYDASLLLGQIFQKP